MSDHLLAAVDPDPNAEAADGLSGEIDPDGDCMDAKPFRADSAGDALECGGGDGDIDSMSLEPDFEPAPDVDLDW